jgi:hypothetical protein
VVEYDVRFSGPWRRFLAAFAAEEADLLAPCVLRRRDDPGWYNWPSLLTAGPEPVGEEDALRAFLPIFRASRRMVETVDAAYRAGWGGHCEATWPTIARVRGLRVADIGGVGEFADARRRGRFYGSTPMDTFLAPGTLLFKPVLLRPGSRRDMLWHPVKPFRWREEFRAGLLDIRAALGRVLRAHAPRALPRRWREPGAFTQRQDGARPLTVQEHRGSAPRAMTPEGTVQHGGGTG